MQSLETIESLAARLSESKTVPEKIIVLDAQPLVASFLKTTNPILGLLSKLSPEQIAAFKQLIAIDQAVLDQPISMDDLTELTTRLIAIDHFYREIGGIAGYQLQVLRLLDKKEATRSDTRYHSPFFFDISRQGDEVQKAIEDGILAQPFMCEMYPLGGAADRLHLVDEKTGSELPAAKLQFAGRTLLEGLLRDLRAREHLYFQRTGKTVVTPVAIMTSHEKNNWLYVQEILEQNRYFGRPKDRFRIFIQPLVPAVNQQGKWLWTHPGKLLLKPGGHGALWKTAKDNGVFEWFESLGARYALIRQINNPLASLDYGLLAFTGIGFQKKMAFGFASCPRLCLSAEGMNVLVEHKIPQGYSYVVSNIEYCDFAKYGIEDRPLVPNEPYSRFTSNTNILFAKLAALEKAVDRCPFPGLTINLKQKSPDEQIGRLESTMQNIADVFAERRRTRLTKEDHALKKTFVTYNHRHKTISTTKKAFDPNRSMNETPENCFFDLMRAHRELLQECRLILPPDVTLEDVLNSHPPFVFLFHPALGPLFQIISQKLRFGSLGDGSELVLEIINADIEHLDVDGSLQLIADQSMGASVVLRHVKVKNSGVDWESSRPFWKGRYKRKESMVVAMEGNSEFIAENVCFHGPLCFEVPDGERLIVTQEGNLYHEQRERITFH